MRKLIILSGPPGSGKSTFIKEQGLTDYTLCPDAIRLMFDAPQMEEYGSSISQKDNKVVFETMHNILDIRMKKGAFTIIDSTHTSEKDFTQYKALCKKYRYKMIVVPFQTPIAELLERNKFRGIKSVPEEIIIKMKSRFDQLTYNFGTVVTPADYSEYIKYQPSNLNEYKAINHIGDIHGCYSVLKNILPLKDDEFYIFLGDYFDRGKENAEVAQWILNNYNRKNIVFLRGNHECNLDDYVNDEEIKSSEFEKTIAQFEKGKIKKKDLKEFAFALLDVFPYVYHEKTVLCSHGGVSKYPENINLINPSQFIRGVGNYSAEIDEIFEAPENTWQVHGHRNIMRLPIEAGKKSFNLTDEVEIGGYLRTLKLNKNGFTSSKYKNDVFIIEDNSKQKKNFETLLDNVNTDINIFGNITSFDVNDLFVNSKNYKVVCRGYERFFDIDKNKKTELSNLKYPIVGYLKENGYFGFIGVDEESEQLIFASKGQLEDEYAKNLESIVRSSISEEQLNKLRLELLSRNACLTVEVIDEEHFPQVINYNNEKKVVLLDIITRDYEFSKKTYNYLVNFAHRYGFLYKRKALTIPSYDELCKIIENVKNYSYNYKGHRIEGFVIEDGNGYQFNLKSGYYNFWKGIKTIIESSEEYTSDEIKTVISENMIPFALKVIDNWKQTGANLVTLEESYK